ncbi:MAG TPA: hypothetical protein VLT89_04700 [Usitatibacter sp.]|nr:hypothetical protein [Usitatibacter sp.]
MKRITAAALAAACIAIVPSLGFAADTPDATFDLTGGTISAGVGVEWAKGTLHYQGRSVPITVKGVSVGGVGAGSISASGEVYHLASLSDVSGNYSSVSAGAALAGGGAVAAMRNDKGVVIQMRSTTQGAEIKLGVDGVAVKVKE